MDPGQYTGWFGFCIAISLGVLALIVLFTLASYVCTRFCIPPPQTPVTGADHLPGPGPVHGSRPLTSAVDGGYSITITPGLNEATLGSFPKLLYSQVKGAGLSCCSICLLEYKERDVMRLLPDCGHYFHSKCVDPWLRTNPSCPNCRTLPVLTPVAMPLAEVPMVMAPRR
ncbi:hypothetical protein EUGRSUZ_J00298 [Eucalyptus grandis]|uniref:Uncharacterized protein n=2 Tax=Eucalyptus grandis TaxID=71139 RepID=A0ACC3J2Y5_EUCGR|nr:hypothetical protein EUGRSUZ_J00298 [Eucalyptus grandis]